jgi:flagellar hook assembly protein FlgD
LPAAVLSSEPGDVDVALLGSGAGLSGEGDLARITFRVKSAGDAAITLAEVTGRDAQNQPVEIGKDVQITIRIPERTALGVGYPNPFRTAARIPVDLHEAGRVTMAVFDVQGRLVRNLLNGEKPAGEHTVIWDGRNGAGQQVGSGMYLVRMSVNGAVFTRQIRLVR